MKQFCGLKKIASNISDGNKGNYTLDMFKDMFPEFTIKEGGVEKFVISEDIIQSFIDLANESFSPTRWNSMWKLAVGWYVAHRITMYLKTYIPEEKRSIKSIVGKATPKGNIASSSLGDASITYDNKSTSEADAKWGELNQTIYGQQLITQARLIGMGGSYVI